MAFTISFKLRLSFDCLLFCNSDTRFSMRVHISSLHSILAILFGECILIPLFSNDLFLLGVALDIRSQTTDAYFTGVLGKPTGVPIIFAVLGIAPSPIFFLA